MGRQPTKAMIGLQACWNCFLILLIPEWLFLQKEQGPKKAKKFFLLFFVNKNSCFYFLCININNVVNRDSTKFNKDKLAGSVDMDKARVFVGFLFGGFFAFSWLKKI
jgi:hypothetical protein